MANLAKYIVQLEAQTAKYRRDLDRANKKLSKFHRFQRSRLKSLTSAWRALAPAVTALVSGGVLAQMIRKSIDQADALKKLTDRLGGTTEAFSELEFVADRSGIAFNTLTMGLQRMQRRVAEAAAGTGEAKGALKELRLEARALNQLAIDEQFETIADALAGVENQGDRTRLAMKLFDSEGVALLQTMQRGAKGIRELRDRARELGISLREDQAAEAVAAKDAIADLNASWTALIRTLSLDAAPVLKDIANALRIVIGEETFAEQPNNLAKQLDAIRRQITFFKRIGDDVKVAELAAKFGEVSDQLNRVNISAFDFNSELQEITVNLDEFAARRDAVAGYADAWAEVNDQIKNFEMPLTAADAKATFEQAAASLEAFNKAQRDSADRLRDKALNTFNKASDDLKEFIKAQDDANAGAERLGFTFASAFEDAIVAGAELRDVLDGLIKDFARILTRKAFTEPFANFVTGFFGGARAAGGPVTAGGSYLVGERGPELFTPGASGFITPNGGGAGPNISYVIDARGADEASIMQKMVPLLERTVQFTKESVRKDIREGRIS